MTEEDTLLNQAIRYIFIIALYSLFLSVITYSVFWISDYFQFKYNTWNWIDWWVFISILAVFIILGFYLVPFYDKFLVYLLERILNRMKLVRSEYDKNFSKKVKELKDKYDEITRDD